MKSQRKVVKNKKENFLFSCNPCRPLVSQVKVFFLVAQRESLPSYHNSYQQSLPDLKGKSQRFYAAWLNDSPEATDYHRKENKASKLFPEPVLSSPSHCECPHQDEDLLTLPESLFIPVQLPFCSQIYLL